jgi:iron complex transport system ATP-binding protein
MTKSIIQTDKVCIGYAQGDRNIVLFQDLSIRLHEGQLVCFMGPNGVGKTSLIRTLAGIQKPLSGEITVHQNNPIAVVLTDKITASHMTVYDLISYGRYPHIGWSVTLSARDHSVIESFIRQVGIESFIDKRLFEISDGQLQMAMIAKALVQETPVLLLDEPTAHLDLNNRVEIMNLLRELARAHNKAVLVATHELDLALQTADWIWLATHNKTIREGIPEDLVLDGSFDDVFQLKGFDLKTGKVKHRVFREKKINLTGSGHELLWTKNALERKGYAVTMDGEITIRIENGRWHSPTGSFQTLEKLLDSLA